jgi:hypothetical protein
VFAIADLELCDCDAGAQTVQIVTPADIVEKSLCADLQRSKTCYVILTENSLISQWSVGEIASL